MYNYHKLLVLGLASILPLSLIAAPATLSLPPSTEQMIQEQVAAGQAGIQSNVSAAEKERAQQAANPTTPANPTPPITPPVKVAPPPKPVISDSTKAAEVNSNVTLENQASDESDNYLQTPTGFTNSPGSVGSNGENSTGKWDYGF